MEENNYTEGRSMHNFNLNFDRAIEDFEKGNDLWIYLILCAIAGIILGIFVPVFLQLNFTGGMQNGNRINSCS